MSSRMAAACFAVSLFTLIASAQTEKIRVACVGDECAAGKRARDGYPAQLQKVLGSAYDVRSFTKAGATLSRHGDRPFDRQAE